MTSPAKRHMMRVSAISAAQREDNNLTQQFREEVERIEREKRARNRASMMHD